MFHFSLLSGTFWNLFIFVFFLGGGCFGGGRNVGGPQSLCLCIPCWHIGLASAFGCCFSISHCSIFMACFFLCVPFFTLLRSLLFCFPFCYIYVVFSLFFGFACCHTLHSTCLLLFSLLSDFSGLDILFYFYFIYFGGVGIFICFPFCDSFLISAFFLAVFLL